MTHSPTLGGSPGRPRLRFKKLFGEEPNKGLLIDFLNELLKQQGSKQISSLTYDKLTFIYLEMAKFDKTEAELVTHFDKWLYLLKNLH